MKLVLFELDSQTRLVNINKEWISTIKEFRDILKRDRGSEGDSDGRKKLQATKEFTFIYHYCDYRSEFINFSEKERYKECIRNAELPDNFKLERDEALSLAVEIYKRLQETPALKMLTELREGVHTGIRVVRKVREELEKKLEEGDFDTLIEEVKGTKRKLVHPVEKLVELLKSLMEIGAALPKTLNALDELEERVKKEMSDEPTIRGGHKKGATEDGRTQKKASHIGEHIFD